ncbi:orotate phosphoribosyltransferase [Deinococcus metalli]|uniref:Orotate phosphoribosyltransferase n=1 Tax=Deinococcus metalli TaxID=1141878 RepID=A0A7W8KJ58_9DEIO|nr:phosphoribosyltransferase family protein [Deinococcus metalli]MBB5379151.1 orotate phosphoribosyltransferase [Deinococcus metalli]GHF64856.1 orotate phosphoribosyltransferase [Deinococcus metalli]
MTLGVLELLRQAGALRQGHTVLQGGAHADGWIDKGPVMRDPGTLDEVALLQAGQLRGAWPDATLLVGVPECGAVLAAFVARHLRLPVAFVRVGEAPAWHRMHVPVAPQRVVIVEDLIGTGRGVRTAAAFLEGEGHTVLGVSAWINRADLSPLASQTLAATPYPGVPENRCLHCAQGAQVAFRGVRE